MAAEHNPKVSRKLSYADALNAGKKTSYGDGAAMSYGAKIKASSSKVDFSSNPPDFPVTADGKRVIISPTKEVEEILVSPFKLMLRGSFLRKRPPIKVIDEEINKVLKPQNPIQVASTAETEVLIRCSSEKDFIKILSRNSIRVGESQMRIFRWSPTKAPNRSLAAIWFSIRSLPLHFSSPECLRKMLLPWGTLLAVHEDVKFLTRPEEALVCIEVNFDHQWPSELVINSQYGTFISQVKALHIPKWCKGCGLMGHVYESCRKKKVVCSFCNKLGHDVLKCRSFKNREMKWVEKQNADATANPMNCFKCRNLGLEMCRCPFQGKFGKVFSENQNGIPMESQRNSATDENPGEEEKFPLPDENVVILKGKLGQPPTNPAGLNFQEKEAENVAAGSSKNVGTYATCISTQAPEDSRGQDFTVQRELISPATSASGTNVKKSKFGPLQWSSIAGDLHLNYKVWGALEEEELQPKRCPSPPKQVFEKTLKCGKIPKDSNFRCGKCATATVPRKGITCKLCSFQNPKKSRGRNANFSPPRYEAKSEECFFKKVREDEWEKNTKRAFQIRAEKNMICQEKVPGKVEDIPPPKMKWGDMSSDDEGIMEENEFQDEHKKETKVWGKKLKSRITSSQEIELRRTRSGRESGQSSEEKREQWIEGIRLLKVKHHDQRHNAMWHQWEVAPEMRISRRERKRLEDLAQRNENAK